jgi:hypothetical protein
MCEHGCRASLHEGHDGPNIRPRQLRNREVLWEGSQGSKRMSRRTERPYQVDGADKLARHSPVRCSAPEINGPVVPREFTFLLRETCKPAPPATAGAAASNGHRRNAGVSRGRSTEGNEPGTPGGPHNSGRAELGRQNTTIGGLVPGALKPTGRALGSDHRGRERVAALSVRTARNRRTRTRMSGGVSRHDKPRERGGPQRVQNSLQELSGYTGIPPGKGWPPPETSLA